MPVQPDTSGPARRGITELALAVVVTVASVAGVAVGNRLYDKTPPADPVTAYVDESYRTFFDRRVDPPSLAHWQQAFAGELTRQQFIETLVTSQEWREVVVRHLEENLFGTTPDETLTAPAEGDQHTLERAALVSDRFAERVGEPDRLVAALRRVLIGRSSPTFDADVAAALRAGGRAAAVDAALAHPAVAERRVRHAFRMIERAPTPAELDEWSPVVADGRVEELLVWLGSTDRFAELAVEQRS